MGKHRILILGGTTEARALAQKLAVDARYDTTLSLAGRTVDPRALPVPVRIGGFGGAEGLAAYLDAERIDLLIDATHPFANRISANAAAAAKRVDVPLFALRRPPWTPQAGDRWISVGSVAEAVAALGDVPRRVFLAIGRQEAFRFCEKAMHSYVVRSVDPVTPPLDVPDVRYILGCGPFGQEDELQLLQDHRIDTVVAKNSGGDATYGKIAAARMLGMEVVMIERQIPADVPTVGDVGAALERIDHWLSPAKKRGL